METYIGVIKNSSDGSLVNFESLELICLFLLRLVHFDTWYLNLKPSVLAACVVTLGYDIDNKNKKEFKKM